MFGHRHADGFAAAATVPVRSIFSNATPMRALSVPANQGTLASGNVGVVRPPHHDQPPRRVAIVRPSSEDVPAKRQRLSEAGESTSSPAQKRPVHRLSTGAILQRLAELEKEREQLMVTVRVMERMKLVGSNSTNEGQPDRSDSADQHHSNRSGGRGGRRGRGRGRGGGVYHGSRDGSDHGDDGTTDLAAQNQD